MDVKVQNITISPDKIRAVINSLERAIERNSKLKQLCEEILKIQGGGPDPAGQGGLDRNRKSRRAMPTGPRKTLRTSIIEVLDRSKSPLGAGALRDAVIADGYSTKAKPSSFYTAVYNAANQADDIVRTKDGFRLKKGATATTSGKSSPKPGKKRTAKKRTAKKRTAKKRAGAKRAGAKRSGKKRVSKKKTA